LVRLPADEAFFALLADDEIVADHTLAGHRGTARVGAHPLGRIRALARLRYARIDGAHLASKDGLDDLIERSFGPHGSDRGNPRSAFSPR
jgi:hypothetical protein